MHKSLIKLINQMTRLPGLNNKSAKKILFFLLNNKESLMKPMLESLQNIIDIMIECKQCGFISDKDICEICQDKEKNDQQICVVENIGNLYSIEYSGAYNGKYHVLKGLISPMDGIMPQDLNISNLIRNLKEKKNNKVEVIFALSSDLNGNSTMNYIIDEINTNSIKNISISVIARGVSMNSDLDYIDHASINASIIHRRRIK